MSAPVYKWHRQYGRLELIGPDPELAGAAVVVDEKGEKFTLFDALLRDCPERGFAREGVMSERQTAHSVEAHGRQAGFVAPTSPDPVKLEAWRGRADLR